LTPGYKEYDVSSLFLLYFTLFFAIIIGDGGYGMIFLGATLFFQLKGVSAKTQPTINLMLILSSATVLWGFLTGNFFAIPSDSLPSLLRGIDFFTSETTGQKNMQLFCFTIALSHLGAAHIWRGLRFSIENRYMPQLGEVGWIAFVVGAYLVIIQNVVGFDIGEPALIVSQALLAGGGALMLIFAVNWKDIGEILNFPFAALGGFVDSLSYIRLFAVGLSGYYVAFSMNSLAFSIMEAGGVGVVAGIFVLLLGHVLNIALCCMGVLVHGIRLNTLEFSGHLGLDWKGIRFSPFRKRTLEP
ncbi:MAG: hypothetical protein HQL32_14670, partial [Planctomycetes bacterium]|nr:hypothetical protein [Planctomycetota bacterium]